MDGADLPNSFPWQQPRQSNSHEIILSEPREKAPHFYELAQAGSRDSIVTAENQAGPKLTAVGPILDMTQVPSQGFKRFDCSIPPLNSIRWK